MPEIMYKFTINVSPSRVFEALTDQNYVAKWWTPDCTLDAKVGGRARFEFKNASGGLDGYSVMSIEQLVPNQLVEWKCIEQDYQGNDDWVGTTIRFRLADNRRGGTDIDFAHVDWNTTDGSYSRCTDGWKHVLRTSLKNYLETGKGEPYLLHLEKEVRQTKTFAEN
jgi:uncharacterized protein YndB with AHSA1/START domain